MFESSFERLGRISEKHSGKLIIAWIVILLLLAPFASLLFGMTSYDVGSGIVPANSMANRADNLLTTYFPGSAAGNGSGDSVVIVTTGTNVNDASVISAYLSAQSLMAKYLNGQGVSGNITSLLTVEKSTLVGFASGAREALNGTYPLLSGLNSEIYQLNTSLNSTLQMVYGIPALFLSLVSQGYPNSTAYNIVLAQVGQSPVSSTYLTSFYQYYNTSNIPVPAESAVYAINNAVTNQSSPYYTLSIQNPPLQSISFSLLANFTLSDFSNPSIYYPYLHNFSYAAIVPELSSNSSISSFIQGPLNTTVPLFFEAAYNHGQAATSSQLLQTTVSLVGNGLVAGLALDPLLSVRPSAMGGFLTQLYSSGNTTQFVTRIMQFSGFNGYPVTPSPYVMRNFVGFDNSTTIILVSLSSNLSYAQTLDLQSAASSGFSAVGGSKLYTSGANVMNSQLATQSVNGMIRALIIGIILSIFIVGIYFRSIVAAFLPLAMFGVSAMTAFSVNALIYKYILRTSISFITPTLLLILLLGLSTDYVVYIMSRYRTELRRGNENPVVVSTKWAGHAVFTSGLTVSMSYVALWVSNVPIFSDSGITNAIGVLLAVIVANTLLVSVLRRGGRKIFWPSKITVSNKPRRRSGMTALSDVVIKHKGKLLILFLVITLLSAYLYAMTPTNMDVFSLLPAGSGVTAIDLVNQSFHGDYFDQSYIILQFSSPMLTAGGYNTSQMAVVTAVENTLLSDSHVTFLTGPTFPYGQYVAYNLTGIPASQQATYKSQMNQYIGSDSRYVLITFQLSALAWTTYSSNFVKSLPSFVASHDGGSFKTYVGGLTEGLNDAYSFTDSSFNNMIPILVFAILGVLAIQISSVFTPMRLVLMVLASVIFALAITYVLLNYVYQLSLLIFLPMFTIITLLAVGLDYDIFMVSRVREEVIKGNTDTQGIVVSMTENGGVIITLGAVLFATFASLLFSGIGLIEEIGVGLALGVLIDTFISWPLFVPSVMLFLKKYNWWPSRLSKRSIPEAVDPPD